MAETDEHFYDRADAHILLSNTQVEDVSKGKVSASMMYANARFSAWISAVGCTSKQDMAFHREENIAYFVDQFQKMLEENYDDYTQHFDAYMRPKANKDTP